MFNFTSRSIILNQTIGERLKKVREGSGLSLKEVARQIGVRQNYLSAIEAGQYGDLPGDIYTAEFIKNYAKFLGVDCRQAARAYLSEKSDGRSRLSPIISRHFPVWQTKARNFFLSPRRVALLGLGCLLAASLIFSWFKSFLAIPKLEIFSPLAYYKTADSKIILSGRAKNVSRVYLNDQVLKLSQAGDFQEVFNLAAGATLLKISAENNKGQSQTVYRAIVVEAGEVAGAKVARATSTLDNLKPDTKITN